VPRVKLGDVAREYKAVSKDPSNLPIVGLEHLTPGDLTLGQWDEGTETTFTKAFKKGQMLFGRRRAYLKKAAVAPFDGICSGDIIVIEAIPGRINPSLLPFIIQNDLLFDFAVGNSAGSLSPRVKWESLKEYEFKLPEISEQEHLVQLLEAAHQAKKSYQRLLEATDDLVKSQFIEMFGDPVLNSKNLPIRHLPDIGENLDSRRIPITSGDRPKGDYPYYGASGIVDYVDSYIFDDDLLLISEDGANLLARVTPIAFSTHGKVWVNNHAHVVRFRSSAVQCYVEHLLNMIDIANYVTGTAQPKLNQAKMNSIPIPLPDQVKMESFEVFVQQSDKSKFELKQSIERVDNLIKSLIQQG